MKSIYYRYFFLIRKFSEINPATPLRLMYIEPTFMLKDFLISINQHKAQILVIIIVFYCIPIIPIPNKNFRYYLLFLVKFHFTILNKTLLLIITTPHSRRMKLQNIFFVDKVTLEYVLILNKIVPRYNYLAINTIRQVHSDLKSTLSKILIFRELFKYN